MIKQEVKEIKMTMIILKLKFTRFTFDQEESLSELKLEEVKETEKISLISIEQNLIVNLIQKMCKRKFQNLKTKKIK